MNNLYRVLRPIYIRTGEIREDGKPYFRVEWEELGQSTSVEEAKQRFGGYPVLEQV